MSDKRIIEEPASEEIFHDDWLVKDSPLNETTKIQASVFMALVAEQAKDGMVPYAMLATEWTALTTYFKDQVVIYNGELYRATDTNVSPTFNPSAWTKISFDTLYRTTLANVKNSICEEWSTSGEYTLNDCAIHEDKLYKCVANTATVGTWVSNEWEPVSIYEIIQNLPKSASDVTYDNTESGLESENVQDALDEVVEDIDAIENSIDEVENSIGDIVETITELSNTTEVTGTASGAIATFTDGADAPLKELKVAIEPQQDLHGYDSPWVGGAGKNKLPNSSTDSESVSGIQINNDKNGKYTISGTSSENVIIDFVLDENYEIKNGDYIHFMNSAINSNASFALMTGNTVVFSEVFSAVNRILDLSSYVGSTITKLRFFFNANQGMTGTMTPMIVNSNTATAFEPYSNICPISGNTEANVVVSPTTDAEDGQTYNIQFKDGDNPLTVYDGTLDVVSGELVVDRVMVTYEGSNDESWTKGSTGARQTWVAQLPYNSNRYANGAMVTNEIPVNASSETASGNMSCRGTTYTSKNFYIFTPLEMFAELTDLKTWLSNYPLQVCFTLATPITYQLTPTQVKSLVGTNNIFADCGDINNVEYVRNLNITINDLLSRING